MLFLYGGRACLVKWVGGFIIKGRRGGWILVSIVIFFLKMIELRFGELK